MVPEWLATTRAAALGRDVLDPPHLDPEPLLVERAQQGQVGVLGEVLVEAELVDGVVARQTAAQERQRLGHLALDVLGREAGSLGSDPKGGHAGAQELLDPGSQGDVARPRRGNLGDGRVRHSGERAADRQDRSHRAGSGGGTCCRRPALGPGRATARLGHRLLARDRLGDGVGPVRLVLARRRGTGCCRGRFDGRRHEPEGRPGRGRLDQRRAPPLRALTAGTGSARGQRAA